MLEEDLKRLILEWLHSLHDLQVQKNSKLQHTYYNAIKSLKDYPSIIKHPKELLKLKYFGDKIVKDVTKQLEKHCKENGYSMPVEAVEVVGIHRSKKANNSDTMKRPNGTDDPDSTHNVPKKRQRKAKKYVPVKKSGGYAILLALLLHDLRNEGLTKSQIIQFATPFSSTSFQVNSSTGNFYSAWNSVKTLINNDYVEESYGTPKYYTLTESGREIAVLLKDTVSSDIEQDDDYVIADVQESFTNEKRSSRRNPLTSSSPGASKSLIMSFDSSKYMDPVQNVKRSLNNELSNSQVGSKREFEIWEKGTFEIKFILDNREIFSKSERDLFGKTLKNMGINTEVRGLPVGDGIWIAVNKKTRKETTLDFIFERKRLDDLAESIKDGRYREQKARLERTGMKTIFYIIEESISSDISKFSDAIKTSISMNTTYSNFHTIKTKNADDTIQSIKNITNQIIARYAKQSLFILEPRNISSQDEYKQFLATMRNQRDELYEVVYSYNTFNEVMGKSVSITVKEIFIRLLMTVRGLSLEKATAIQRHFKTPNSLFKRYELCHEIESNCKQLISDQLKDEIGVYKIGPSLSDRISQVFCPNCTK